MSGARPRESGFTLIEVLIALAIVALGIIGTVVMVYAANQQLQLVREQTIARLAANRVSELTRSIRIRGANASDNTAWLFRGGWEIARTTAGVPVLVPDLRTAPLNTDWPGMSPANNSVTVAFPVPPLTAPDGSANVGRLMLMVNEIGQPIRGMFGAPVPASFPFPVTPGNSRLDCNGNGSGASNIDLRTAYDSTLTPTRLVPARIEVTWRSATGRTETLVQHHLIGTPGY